MQYITKLKHVDQMKSLLASPGTSIPVFIHSFVISNLDTTPEVISRILDLFDQTIMHWSQRLPNPSIYKQEKAPYDSEKEDNKDESEESNSVEEMAAAVAAGKTTTLMSNAALEEAQSIQSSPMYKGIVLLVRILLKRRAQHSAERARIFVSLLLASVVVLFCFCFCSSIIIVISYFIFLQFISYFTRINMLFGDRT